MNISGVRTGEHEDRTITVHLTVSIAGLEQLTRLLRRIESVRGIFAVSRSRDGARNAT